MSRYTGPQMKGAARELRLTKRLEAEERNRATPPERRSVRAGGDVLAHSMTAAEWAEARRNGSV